MAETREDFSPPKPALIAAAALIVAAFVGAVVAKTTDLGAERMTESPFVASRLLTIENGDAGQATVTDATNGQLIAQTKAGPEEGFIWGAVNGLSYGRKQIDGPADGPYELARRADGKLVLTDLITGQQVFLDGFGSVNAAAWARLLEKKEASK